MANRFERVTLTPEDGKARGRTFILKVTKETDRWLSGYEVTKDGDDAVPASASYDRKLHLIDKSALAKRVPLKWNLTYAVLETA